MTYFAGYIILSYVLTYLMLKYVYQKPGRKEQRDVAYWSLILSPVGFIFLFGYYVFNVMNNVKKLFLE